MAAEEQTTVCFCSSKALPCFSGLFLLTRNTHKLDMTQKAARALQIMREFAAHRVGQGRFDTAVLSKAKITDGSEGRVKCEIPVSAELLNGVGALHGGAIATIVDSVSTWAVVSVGNNVPGVSIELSISFMKAAFPGETLLAEAWTSHIGRRLAFLTVDIRNKDTGVLLAQGKHTKYMSVATTQNPSDEGKS